MNRREFIAAASMAPLSAALGMHAFGRGAAWYGGPYKISLNCYSFNTLLTNGAKGASPGMTLAQAIDFCKTTGFDAIDMQGYYFPGYPAVPTDEYVAGIKDKAAASGIIISGTGVNDNFASTDAAARAADVRLVKNWVEVAAKLGAPVLRVFCGALPAGWENRWSEVAAWTADCIKQCADYAHSYGVKIVVQNHADLLKTGDQIRTLAGLVDSPDFGVLLDTGSFVTANLFADLAAALPYATNFLIKQNVENDLPDIVNILRTGGFTGYLLIEALSGDPYAVVPRFFGEVRDAVTGTTAALKGSMARRDGGIIVTAGGPRRFRVSGGGEDFGRASFALIDARGTVILRETRPAAAARDWADFEADGVPAGAYFLECVSGGRRIRVFPLVVGK
jgi:sugar phosphate isomerase/epimerase